MSTSTNAANDPRTQELPFYDATGNEIEMKWSVIVFLAFSTAALIYAVTERLAEHK